MDLLAGVQREISVLLGSIAITALGLGWKKLRAGYRKLRDSRPVNSVAVPEVSAKDLKALDDTGGVRYVSRSGVPLDDVWFLSETLSSPGFVPGDGEELEDDEDDGLSKHGLDAVGGFTGSGV